MAFAAELSLFLRKAFVSVSKLFVDFSLIIPYNFVNFVFILEEITMQREHLGSRLGFLLLSAGCAIGVGNVWKFPWMTGQYGGGAFVAIYLLFLLILGVFAIILLYNVLSYNCIFTV